MSELKPLFIPLKTLYYEQFISGKKHSELRLYGARWNERTCAVGRRVILSKGYGKKHRVNGFISQFYKRDATTFGGTYRQAIFDCYGTLNMPIAEIRISLDCTPTKQAERE